VRQGPVEKVFVEEVFVDNLDGVIDFEVRKD